MLLKIHIDPLISVVSPTDKFCILLIWTNLCESHYKISQLTMSPISSKYYNIYLTTYSF